MQEASPSSVLIFYTAAPDSKQCVQGSEQTRSSASALVKRERTSVQTSQRIRTLLNARGRIKARYLFTRAESDLQRPDYSSGFCGPRPVFVRERVFYFSAICVFWCFFGFSSVFCVKLSQVVLWWFFWEETCASSILMCLLGKDKSRGVDRLLSTMLEEREIEHGLLQEDGMRRKSKERTEDAEFLSEKDREERHSRRSSASRNGTKTVKQNRRPGQGKTLLVEVCAKSPTAMRRVKLRHYRTYSLQVFARSPT